MAMMLGQGKRLSAEMNVTPLIDVLLVLIIIFMLLPHHTAGEKALIPQPAQPGRPEAPPQKVVLQLRAAPSGTQPELLINHEPVSWGQLQARLRQIYAQRSTTILFVKAENALPFEPVAQAIDVAHSAVPGLMVGLLTAQIEDSK